MKKPGRLVISLDFELMWGMFDKVTIDTYGDNIRGVEVAVPELLSLFQAYGIHATWATVGMLMYPHAAALEAALPPPELRPRYKEKKLSSYAHLATEVLQQPAKEPYYFAPELVAKIIQTPGQELASHTFSHYYTLEGGENSETIFAADCVAMQAAADRFDVQLSSIVFPRNQTTTDALVVAEAHGITCYRGTESHFVYRSRSEAAQTNTFIRGLRLLDHYINLSGHHTYPLPSGRDTIVNVPASRFLRPFMPALCWLEPLRLRRIKRAMTHAAEHGEVFHLWWHPHNFGINRKENISNLVNILEHFKTLEKEFGMESKNMREIATQVKTSMKKDSP